MAAYLPNKLIQIPKAKWSFSLNPGPFNLKEPVIITIYANFGSNPVYALGIITIVKTFYQLKTPNPVAAMLLTQTTQNDMATNEEDISRSIWGCVHQVDEEKL